jgi:hypothetical protein
MWSDRHGFENNLMLSVRRRFGSERVSSLPKERQNLHSTVLTRPLLASRAVTFVHPALSYWTFSR